VVIAIIALLMAMLIPALEAAKARARDMMCTSNLRSIGLGLMMYLQDNDGVTADVYGPRSPVRNTAPINDWCNGWRWVVPGTNPPSLMPHYDIQTYWGVAYINHLKNREVFGCPAYKSVAGQLNITAGINTDEVWLIDEAGYGFNAYASSRPIDEIRKPSEFIFCHDHVEPRIEQGSIDMFHNDGPGTMNLTQYRPGSPRLDRMPLYRGIFRHAIKLDDDFRTGGKANVLWIDGHVSWLWETTGDDVPEKWYTNQ